MGTKTHPGKFDCYANALPNEPIFILLARDKNAAYIVETWAAQYKTEKERVAPNRMTPEQYAKYYEAMNCADEMRKWGNDYHNQKAVEIQKKSTLVAYETKPV